MPIAMRKAALLAVTWCGRGAAHHFLSKRFPETVLLGYSVEPEFCVSSSEFTAVAVPQKLVSPLVLAGVADGQTHR
jgi:hypothetical protein